MDISNNQVSNTYYEPRSRRKIELSRHAARRSRQRSIPPESVKLIVAYGEQSYDGVGGVRYIMTSRAVAQLERAVGHSDRVESLAGCYAVISATDGSVITLGHRRS